MKKNYHMNFAKQEFCFQVRSQTGVLERALKQLKYGSQIYKIIPSKISRKIANSTFLYNLTPDLYLL
ncbi:MAG: hypothetical protein ABI840_03760, partial [bacterium]